MLGLCLEDLTECSTTFVHQGFFKVTRSKGFIPINVVDANTSSSHSGIKESLKTHRRDLDERLPEGSLVRSPDLLSDLLR